MKIKVTTFTNVLDVRKYTALFQEKGLVEVVAFASINKERYFENFGFGENEFNELVNAGTTFGSKFKTIPRSWTKRTLAPATGCTWSIPTMNTQRLWIS